MATLLGDGYKEESLPEQDIRPDSLDGGRGIGGMASFGSDSGGGSGVSVDGSSSYNAGTGSDKLVVSGTSPSEASRTIDTNESAASGLSAKMAESIHGKPIQPWWESFRFRGSDQTDPNNLARSPNPGRLDNAFRYGHFQESEDRAGSDLRVRGAVRLPGHSNETHRIASMCGVLYRPHPRVADIVGFTRMVTLPDFQGLGLAFVLANTVASAYKALGKRLHSYPNHPAWIRSYQRSKDWIQVKREGTFSPVRGSSSTVAGFGGKRCSVFFYIGPAMNLEDARNLIYAGDPEKS
jgi:GNAT superfamily N-acetyltransferase